MSDTEDMPAQWRGRGRPKGSVAKPKRYAKIEDAYVLPSNEEILTDLQSCGCSISKLLEAHVNNSDDREPIAIQILAQLNGDPVSREAFENLRVQYEQMAALRATDMLISLASSRGPAQVQALKIVRELTKGHTGKVREAIDDHLEGLEEDATES